MREKFPESAIEDEGRLRNFRLREHFLTKLFLLARIRMLVDKPSTRGLVRFQTENKLLLMAYNQKEMRLLGRIVANREKRGLGEVMEIYALHLHQAFARMPRYTSHINVLMHALGYVSNGLGGREKQHFLGLLDEYRAGRATLAGPLSVLQSWIARFEEPYLAQQSYLEPYPPALMDLRDSGRN